jgi:hypothetical protein
MLEVIAISSVALSATGILNNLHPKRDFRTHFLKVQLIDPPAQGAWLDLDYYTVGIDGRWDWRKWRNHIAPGPAVALCDDDGLPVHGAEIKAHLLDRFKMPLAPAESMRLLNEAYRDRQRSEWTIGVRHSKTFTSRALIIDNRTAEPVQTIFRIGVEGRGWTAPDQFDIAPQTRMQIMRVIADREVPVVGQFLQVMVKGRTFQDKFDAVMCDKPYSAWEIEDYELTIG